MTEREKVVMLYVLLSFVEEIHDRKKGLGPWAIQQRLRMFEKSTEELLKNYP